MAPMPPLSRRHRRRQAPGVLSGALAAVTAVWAASTLRSFVAPRDIISQAPQLSSRTARGATEESQLHNLMMGIKEVEEVHATTDAEEAAAVAAADAAQDAAAPEADAAADKAAPEAAPEAAAAHAEVVQEIAAAKLAQEAAAAKAVQETAAATKIAHEAHVAMAEQEAAAAKVAQKAAAAAAAAKATQDPAAGKAARLTAKDRLLETLAVIASKGESEEAALVIDQLVQDLASSDRGSRFDEATAEGAWSLVFTRKSPHAPRSTRMPKTYAGCTSADFNTQRGELENGARFLLGAVKVTASAKYAKVEGFPGRVSCDISDSALRLFGYLKVPLRQKKDGGWLDFLYLDEDLRITRGDSGGLFMHVRPDKVKELLHLD
mmetsp:Transcript_60400/g.97780  ORF Transcript_60400/g.97780 Transcript_60400/m.97780 type:complete len:378 (-) Transcript_60400:200-1333(-)